MSSFRENYPPLLPPHLIRSSKRLSDVVISRRIMLRESDNDLQDFDCSKNLLRNSRTNNEHMTNSDYIPSQLDDETRNDIRDIISRFLRECSLPYGNRVKVDGAFYKECIDESIRRGCAPEGRYSLIPFLPGGVLMATAGYGHLKDTSIKVLIALYTACGIYLDDVYQKDIDAVHLFNERFFKHAPQADPVMDCFAGIILELSDRYDRVVANIMVTSTLNAVNALLLEYETRGMTLSTAAVGYPTFSRVMSGASEAFTFFIFPREVSLPNFIQTLHQIMIFINNTNDLLSFYKEESDGETVNRPSFLATLHGSTKIEAIYELMEESIKAYKRAVQMLSSDKQALQAFQNFSRGFISFHTALPRYRLDELGVLTTPWDSKDSDCSDDSAN